MGYILILMLSVGLAGPSLDEREKSNKKFRKEFKKKYGYEWGAYGFNMDADWEATALDVYPERMVDRDDRDDMDAEPSMNGGKE